MDYPIPSYLEHPADLAGNMISGFHAGAQVAQQQAALQQQAQETALRMAAQQEQMHMEQIRQQQQLEMQKQMQTAQMGLRREELAARQQAIQAQTRAAAQKFAAQQRYTQLFQSYGGDEAAARRAMLEVGPFMGMNGEALVRATAPQRSAAPMFVPPNQTTGEPGHYVNPNGGVTLIPQPQRTQLTPSETFGILKQQEETLAKDALRNDPGPKGSPEDKAKYATTLRQLDEIRKRIYTMGDQGYNALVPQAQPEKTKALTPPARKEDLIVGQTYMIHGQVREWNGDKFKLVK